MDFAGEIPAEYGPHKTPYNRFVRWDRLGVVDRIFNGLSFQLHTVVEGEGKSIIIALTAGQVSDHIRTKITYPELPDTKVMIADTVYDSEENRAAFKAEGIEPRTPPRKWRKVMQTFLKTSHKQCHRVANTFGRHQD